MLGSQTQPVRQGLYARNPDVAHQMGVGCKESRCAALPQSCREERETGKHMQAAPSPKVQVPAGSSFSSETDEKQKAASKPGTMSRARPVTSQ